MQNNTRIQWRSLVIGVQWLVGVMASLGCVTAAAATLAPNVQEKLGNATFEVVLGKPDADPLTYEKPLPLELIPYRERTDKFRSIGTAFAIGPNRFVTAAHVIVAGNGSQYGPLALRNSAGMTYRVTTVIKYSSGEDYAVFSVQGNPSVVPLQTRSQPPVNTPVFAVGNAFGEGIVARDGMYTSDTPEERDGRWQWLRFSAAASPGNSGGPLIDSEGKVIGVVVRKSPNENLNFALPIGRVLDGDEANASFENRSSYHFLIMKATDTIDLSEKMPLPKTLEEFYASVRDLDARVATKVHADFMKNHADTIFPAGKSDELLNTVYAEAFPKLISQSDSGVWTLAGDAPRKVQLDNNGYLQESTSAGFLLLRLKSPDGINATDLTVDSKQFMDLLLKAIPLPRPIGTDSVRVTSMGTASRESWFTDDYQRKWQVRDWLMPFSDTVIITVALPTPDGMVMMMSLAPTGMRDSVIREMEAFGSFVYVSYTGTLAQWQGFLAHPLNLPTTLSKANIQFEYGRGLGIRTPRFELLVPASAVEMKIDAGSELMLKYSYMRDRDRTVWDLGGVFLADNEQEQKWIGLVRRPKPSPNMPQDTRESWQKMITGVHPWEDAPFTYNNGSARTEMNSMVNMKDVAGGKASVGYTMTVNSEGVQSSYRMKSDFHALEHGFKDLE